MDESPNRSARRHEPGPAVLAGRRALDRERTGPARAEPVAPTPWFGVGQLLPTAGPVPSGSAPERGAREVRPAGAVETPVRRSGTDETHIGSGTGGGDPCMPLGEREQGFVPREFFTTTTAVHAWGPGAVTR
ncbi:hypothetical protein ACIRP2_31005 [Streptomyces sp. NPDC101194]|uniref:hypothetical protein n=1 Tax=Streptomyces sp. NPDC101194 TaxID=3366127 RepID=UPI0037F73EC2